MADEEERAPAEEEEEADEAAAEDAEKGADEAALEEEAVDEDNVDETEEDPFELLDEESEDNEVEERMYREYIDLMKQIDSQNGVINDLKERSYELRDKPCQTRNDKAEYKRLRICLNQENIKLNTMMNRAVQLQNNGSKRLYGSIELATSGFEDNLLNSSSGCRKASKCPASTSRPRTAQEICDALDDSESNSDEGCCSTRRCS
ncbi:glutamic acid-rich protein [Drosophila montana]|uniref:glutamic acid-rich protein n=1 Tax=Drosophila montana TaxID=40370 RepID=UPI00313C4B9D